MNETTVDSTAMTATQFDQLMGEMSSMKQDMSSVKREMSSVKQDMSSMKEDFRSLKNLVDQKLDSQRNWVVAVTLAVLVIYLAVLGMNLGILQTMLNLS